MTDLWSLLHSLLVHVRAGTLGTYNIVTILIIVNMSHLVIIIITLSVYLYKSLANHGHLALVTKETFIVPGQGLKRNKLCASKSSFSYKRWIIRYCTGQMNTISIYLKRCLNKNQTYNHNNNKEENHWGLQMLLVHHSALQKWVIMSEFFWNQSKHKVGFNILLIKTILY